MQAIPDKDFDKLFQQKFETFEVEPSSAVWRGITSELDKEKGKRKEFPLFQAIAIAASVLLVLSAGIWLFSPQEKIRLQGKEDLVMKDDLPDADIDLPNIPEVSKVAKTTRSGNSGRGIEPAIAVAPKPAQEEKIAIQEAVAVTLPPVKEAEPAKPVAPRVSAPKEEKTNPANDQPVLAFAGDQSPIAESRKDTEQQHRVKTVGDLVNFVIGKVDPRTDKIIQFKNDEEGGSEVTGINLGLLKFKNRNR